MLGGADLGNIQRNAPGVGGRIKIFVEILDFLGAIGENMAQGDADPVVSFGKGMVCFIPEKGSVRILYSCQVEASGSVVKRKNVFPVDAPVFLLQSDTGEEVFALPDGVIQQEGNRNTVIGDTVQEQVNADILGDGKFSIGSTKTVAGGGIECVRITDPVGARGKLAIEVGSVQFSQVRVFGGMAGGNISLHIFEDRLNVYCGFQINPLTVLQDFYKKVAIGNCAVAAVIDELAQ